MVSARPRDKVLKVAICPASGVAASSDPKSTHRYSSFQDQFAGSQYENFHSTPAPTENPTLVVEALKGRRRIKIPPSVVAELKEHWTQQQAQRLKLGLGRAADGDLVFPSWNGTARSPNATTREWVRALANRAITVLGTPLDAHRFINQVQHSMKFTGSRKYNPNGLTDFYTHVAMGGVVLVAFIVLFAVLG